MTANHSAPALHTAAERAKDTELAAHWLPATSPSGRRCQVRVSQAAVWEDMRRAGWRIRQPSTQTGAEREAV